MTILVMSILLLASCEDAGTANGGNNANQNECPHSHQEVVAETKSTCDKAGYTEGRKCTDCGEYVVAPAEKPLLAHREQTFPAQAATCNEDGKTESKRCVMCLQFTSPATVIPSSTT